MTDTEKQTTKSLRGARPPTTWHLKPAKEMNVFERICLLDKCPEEVYEKRPNMNRGAPPSNSILGDNLFILTTSSIPIVIQSVCGVLFPNTKWPVVPTVFFYHLSFVGFAITMLRRMHRKMRKFGTFDEQNRGRDMVDDAHRNRLGRSILLYTILRTIGIFVFGFKNGVSKVPLRLLSIWSPLKICGFLISLDYFFYCYHRSCHEIDSLWFVHRAHHGTKHPTPILSILADDIQECLEIAIIPMLASLTVPLNFAELWYAAVYLLFVEAAGHSGIRQYWPHPLLFWLRPLSMDLIVEDHDLHHRLGRGGVNYGKQTRIWDRIFGTTYERIECEQK